MAEYDSIFNFANNFNNNATEDKFQYDIEKIRENVRDGSLSIFSKVIDATIEERYPAFKKAGYVYGATKNKSKLENLLEDLEGLNSAFRSKVAELAKASAYPANLLEERLEKYEKMIENCDNYFHYGMKQARKDELKIIDDFEK